MTSPEGANAARRLDWVDSARGIGIVLVVFGHVERGLTSAGLVGSASALQSIDEWIYSFHMPLFFVLSGLFAERRVALTWWPFLALQLRTLGYPYLLWSALQTSVQIVLSGSTNHAATWNDLLTIPLAPRMQFWFLYALLVVALMYKCLRAVLPNPRLVLLVACGFFAVQPLLLGRVWSVLCTALLFLLHFTLGAVVHGPASSAAVATKTHRLLIAAALFFSGMTALVLCGAEVPMNTPLGVVSASLGVAATLAMAMAASRTPRLNLLRTWGRASLQIFLAHTLASAGARIVLVKLGVHDIATHLVLGTLVGVAGPLLLAKLVEQHRVPYVFSWPSRAAAK